MSFWHFLCRSCTLATDCDSLRLCWRRPNGQVKVRACLGSAWGGKFRSCLPPAHFRLCDRAFHLITHRSTAAFVYLEALFSLPLLLSIFWIVEVWYLCIVFTPSLLLCHWSSIRPSTLFQVAALQRSTHSASTAAAPFQVLQRYILFWTHVGRSRSTLTAVRTLSLLLGVWSPPYLRLRTASLTRFSSLGSASPARTIASRYTIAEC
jgi:hypothetical protein